MGPGTGFAFLGGIVSWLCDDRRTFCSRCWRPLDRRPETGWGRLGPTLSDLDQYKALGLRTVGHVGPGAGFAFLGGIVSWPCDDRRTFYSRCWRSLDKRPETGCARLGPTLPGLDQYKTLGPRTVGHLGPGTGFTFFGCWLRARDPAWRARKLQTIART
jgi:hypothetical protein